MDSVTFVPAMAIDSGILDGTGIDTRSLDAEQGYRRIALVWRRSSPREPEFQLLAETLRKISREVIPGLDQPGRKRTAAPREDGELRGAAVLA